MRTPVIASHPALARSRANALLAEAVHGLPEVEIRHLEALYPGGRIFVRAKHAAALSTERIVFQFPFYGYATPLLLKRWLDDLLEYGWSDGPGARNSTARRCSWR